MSPKLCLTLLAIFGSFQAPVTGAPPASLTISNDALTKLATELSTLAENLSQKLEAVSAKIDSAMEATDEQLSSNIAFLEEAWGKKIDCTTAQYEACSAQINRLFELSSEIVSSTKQCAADYRQKLQDSQESATLQSSSLKNSVNKLAGIGVGCVSTNGQLPLCVVSTNPLSYLANLLQEGGETVGTGLARAEAYGAQILSCWKQSSMESAPLAQQIIRDIAQCAKAQST